jgi:hypothetical protein
MHSAFASFRVSINGIVDSAVYDFELAECWILSDDLLGVKTIVWSWRFTRDNKQVGALSSCELLSRHISHNNKP